MAAAGSWIVTGSSGFVGRVVMKALDGAATRLHLGAPDWEHAARAAAFEGATVLHLAARAHQMRGATEDDYTRDNAVKTRVLAEIAARGGARRLVFLSSIKVNGEETSARPFTPADIPAPRDPYARSKRAGEEALAEIAKRHPLETTIVRAPLVYGEGARGNLSALLRLADSPWPLPFAAIDNRRSFVHVDDLAQLLLACASNPLAAGRTYLAAHPAPVSTRELIEGLRSVLHRPRRLFAVPRALLEATAAACGQGERMRRLTRSLEADPTSAQADLGWTAKRSLRNAVEDLVRGHRAGLGT